MELDLEVKEELEQIFMFRSLLGQGSFGCVYECLDKRNNEIYAVKIISKSNVKRSKMECLREEARLLSSIDHPNIVKVYEFVETNTYIFLRMELIRNGTLCKKLIKERWDSGRKFTDDEISVIMGSIFRSLDYIHSMNIIHRDIKPDNILIQCYDDLSKIKLADFGLSTKLDFFYPKTATSKCGTMLYMAPEILNNVSYTKSVDIWSCSIIMFMLAQGKHPFFVQKMSTEDYKRKIKTIVFPALNNGLAQDFLVRISKVEANERYTTQEALKHPWLTRKFDDEIPQSLHESYLGFEKSHTISNIFKLLLTVKNICSANTQKIPSNYLKKKEEQSSESSSLNLSKIRSRKLMKQLSDISNSSQSSTINDSSEKQPKEEKNETYDKDAPALAKLNAIFDTLLDRKHRHKDKVIEGNSIILKEKENKIQSPPKEIPFKDKLEREIENLAGQFKCQEINRSGGSGNEHTLTRKILRSNKRKKVDGFSATKEDFRILNESSGSGSTFKIRHRKKATSAARLCY